VREHGKGDIGTMTIEEFAKLIQATIDTDFKRTTVN
jgi:hypothetical protein